ncbi:hypothetical protein [uncultured Muribaculum sp.]|uniref:hypothetical protein n=1 Tax=uncultured Muribaculum sp. TaxID=1918613 RepID=UPI00261A9F22|nr:hypothetical protein [uncultured Muribaculum sp.]
MEKLFCNSVIMRGDAYIADYTNDDNLKHKGVEISSTSPEQIGAFHLSVGPDVDIHYLAVNIEEYPAFTKGIQNCEALLASLSSPEERKRWNLFIELKYCAEHKIDSYGPKAIDQMDAVRKKLIGMGKLSRDTGIFHFNYCSPDNFQSEPFDGFKETQNATLTRVESEGVIFHARMELIALDGSLIIEPPVEI